MKLCNDKGAEFSECGKYRLKLWRMWDYELPKAMVIGLNPSTANCDTDDPTIGNLKRILAKLDYGGFYMMNLFTIISSNPDILKSQNNWGDWLKDRDLLIDVSKECNEVIFAWGKFKEAENRAYECVRQFPYGKCFGKNKNGSPCHPLALMYNGTVKNPKLIEYK